MWYQKEENDEEKDNKEEINEEKEEEIIQNHRSFLHCGLFTLFYHQVEPSFLTQFYRPWKNIKSDNHL